MSGFNTPGHVQSLRSLGFAVCVGGDGSKRTTVTDWTTRSAEPGDFGPDDGVGILGGPLSDCNLPDHSLVITDLDVADAIARADRYLPKTPIVDGRPSKRGSHWYHLVPNDTIPPPMVSTARAAAPAVLAAKGHAGPAKKGFNRGGQRAIDFVGTGGMVVAPPSRHPSGERREWEAIGEAGVVPAVVPLPVLWEQVCRLAHAIGCDPPSGLGWPWEPRRRPFRVTIRSDRPAPDTSVVGRAAAYLSRCEPSVSGQRGHDRLFFAACRMVHGFALDRETAFHLLAGVFNPLCSPRWSDQELWHKVDDAEVVATHRYPRGHLRDAPFPVARADRPRVTILIGGREVA
jgi:hypothetical protein